MSRVCPDRLEYALLLLWYLTGSCVGQIILEGWYMFEVVVLVVVNDCLSSISHGVVYTFE